MRAAALFASLDQLAGVLLKPFADNNSYWYSVGAPNGSGLTPHAHTRVHLVHSLRLVLCRASKRHSAMTLPCPP